MRNLLVRSLCALTVVGCVLISVGPVYGQRVTLDIIGGKPPEYVKPKPYDGEYDAHDLSGIWFRVGGDRSHGTERSNPPLTAAGIAEMTMHHPTRSYLPEITKADEDPKPSNYPATR